MPGRRDDSPLVPQVGNAIARYLRETRPQSVSRVVFLMLHAPFTPLSPSALYSTVNSHFRARERPGLGRSSVGNGSASGPPGPKASEVSGETGGGQGRINVSATSGPPSDGIVRHEGHRCERGALRG